MIVKQLVREFSLSGMSKLNARLVNDEINLVFKNFTLVV